MKKTSSVGLVLLAIAAIAAWAQVKVPGEVVSVFAKNCLDCHKGKFPPRGLSWEAKKIEAAIDAPSREVPALKIIDTAAPESSYVLMKVRGEKGIQGTRMPPTKALDPASIKVLEDWILSLKKVPGPSPI
jgi:hypothetical protein